jgi:two-component system response regulator ResD
MASPSRTALVVGDSALLRTYATAILGSAGFTCVEATNGFFALETLSENQFDLCLVDLDMPPSDGMTIFALTLTGGYRKPAPAVIGVSRHSGRQRAGVWAEDATLVGVLGKPFRPEELLALVRDAFGKTRAAE